MLAFLLILISLTSYGSSVGKLKEQLNERSLKVTKLGAQIKSLEKSINDKNQEYLEVLGDLKLMQGDFEQVAKQLSSFQIASEKEAQVLEEVYKHYILAKLSQAESESLVADKVYGDTIEAQLEELQKNRASFKKLKKEFEMQQTRLNSLQQREHSTYNIILDLEKQKGAQSELYLSELERKNDLREKMDTMLIRKVISPRPKQKQGKAKLSSALKLPLASYKSLKGSAKGVTFMFDQVTPVYATDSGTVVYSGELGSFGKIVMIDHGKELRSLVLGDMRINVKKGQVVSKGEVLAYTISEPGINKGLYYELRQKNIAQNTLKVLKENKVL